jgi:tRNA nucleotidyltransferase (CCA-adding enzyme)
MVDSGSRGSAHEIPIQYNAMTIPAELQRIVETLSQHGRPFLVGGCVRDSMLGLSPKDFDVEVFGVNWETLAQSLQPFGPTDIVGNHFGVIKVRAADHEYDFSLPRRERKTGKGHKGFSVEPDPDLGVAEASARRDFTINALMFDPMAEEIVDHHNGLADLKARVLRNTSAAFTEDPLRVMRAFQLAARFDLSLAPETATLCGDMVDSFRELPRERVWGEWRKFATQSTKPSRGLAVLKETGWLVHFPEIAALDGLPQEPAWHPEGDVFKHVGLCLDALVTIPGWIEGGPGTREVLSFAVLATTSERPKPHSGRRRTGWNAGPARATIVRVDRSLIHSLRSSVRHSNCASASGISCRLIMPIKAGHWKARQMQPFAASRGNLSPRRLTNWQT